MNYQKIYAVHPDGKVIREDGKEMRQYERDGYKSVCLKCTDQKFRFFYIHRLVCHEWVSNPSNLPIVLHLDDDPSNNHWTNLQWGTQKDNIRDMMNKGRRGNPRRIKHYKLVSPEGVLYEITNMREFCKDKDLDPGAMTKMHAGIKGRATHKGWTKYQGQLGN
jgi:hypothetical protein